MGHWVYYLWGMHQRIQQYGSPAMAPSALTIKNRLLRNPVFGWYNAWTST